MISCDWQPKLPAASLAPGEVHLYALELSEFAPHQGRFEGLLSPAERLTLVPARPKVRTERAVSRGALRLILSRYAGMAPGSLEFLTSLQGKPYLSEPAFEFNLSHSGELVLIGVSAGNPIGVDIEAVRSGIDAQTLAERFLQPAEAAVIAALPEPERDSAFVRCWTRKEAVIKAFGRGIWDMLQLFEVGMGDEPRIIRLDLTDVEAGSVTLSDVMVADGYWAALASLGPISKVERCRLMPDTLFESAG